MYNTTVFYKYNLFFIGRASEELLTHIPTSFVRTLFIPYSP